MMFKQMRNLILLVCLLAVETPVFSQSVYTLKADSVKITNCDSAELILENHTQGVKGFLYNTGNGRTMFKRGVQRINDTLFQIGADTLTVPRPSAWLLTGNTGTNPPTNYIGTNDPTPLVFKVGAVEKMRLFANGVLSLNSGSAWDTSDLFKFQVKGNIFSSGTQNQIGNFGVLSGADAGSLGISAGVRMDPGYPSLTFEGCTQGWTTDMFTFATSFGDIPKIIYNVNGSIVRIASGFSGSNVTGICGNALFINPIYDLPASYGPDTVRGIYYSPRLTNLNGKRHISIETVSGDALFGTDSGSVGVGVRHPTAQLHTSGSVRFAGLTDLDTLSRVLVCDANGNVYYRNASSLAANDPIHSSLAINNDPIRSSLAVNGTITAKKLRLSASNWPDYVFDRDYHLQPLPELEQFIRTNNHLPDINPAAQIDKEGSDVGETQQALLKKIEELTLYAIGQDKLLTAQSRELSGQQEKLAAQDERYAAQNKMLVAQAELLKEQSEKLAALESQLVEIQKQIIAGKNK